MNFVHGVPWFAVSIGLIRQGRPILGVIYDPIRKELFTAVHGGGAQLNGRRIRVSRVRHLKDGLLSTGFSSQFHNDPARYLRWFEQLQQRSHGVRRVGSTAISLAYVACGRFDGFYEHDLWPWDVAAGMVLVREAGGRLTDFEGRDTIHAHDFLVSNGALHEPDAHGLVRQAEYAGSLAGRRAHLGGELREVVRGKEKLEGLAVPAQGDELVPLRDLVS